MQASAERTKIRFPSGGTECPACGAARQQRCPRDHGRRARPLAMLLAIWRTGCEGDES
jgi:hypothetical protein